MLSLRMLTLSGALACACQPAPASPGPAPPDAEATPVDTPAAPAEPPPATPAATPEPPPLSPIQAGPDSYQIPAEYRSSIEEMGSFGLFTIDLAAPGAVALFIDRINRPDAPPGRWVARRGGKKLPVTIEYVDVPPPAGLVIGEIGGGGAAPVKLELRPPGHPIWPDERRVHGIGTLRPQLIVLAGKLYGLSGTPRNTSGIVEIDPSTGTAKFVGPQDVDYTTFTPIGDRLAVLGTRKGKDLVAVLDLSSGTFIKELGLRRALDGYCGSSELRLLDWLVVVPGQDRAFAAIECHHGQD
jgi:hypothetical protein